MRGFESRLRPLRHWRTPWLAAQRDRSMDQQPVSEERDWENYETGPFCRHWGDPSDCDELCKGCGHKCREHSYGNDDAECMEDGCECKNWVGETPSDSAGEPHG